MDTVALQLSGKAKVEGGGEDDDNNDKDDAVEESSVGVSIVATRPINNMILFGITGYLQALSTGDVYRG